LEFKLCDSNKLFTSKYQAIGHKLELKKNDIKSAKKDLENNISLEKFLKKYPGTKLTKNILIVQFKYKDYEENDVMQFTEIRLDNDYGLEFRFDENLNKYNPKNLGNWIFKYSAKSSYSDEYIDAFYLPNKMESKKIPLYYSKMIGYADCLIDTTSTKFKKDLESGWVEIPQNWKSLPSTKQAELLNKLRSTRVVGSCSQDSSPRRHAINIAMLSAQTQNWEVFLKAHLDVMNDRFERISDGSYAWAGRKTYLKELEELHIDVLDLIIGISLRMEDPAINHYYGSIRRIGRALTETNNKSRVEQQLFSILTDTELDIYNRVLGFYIINNYYHNLEDKNEKLRFQTKLEEAVKSLPKELYSQIEF
jgi:hypothetical protein